MEQLSQKKIIKKSLIIKKDKIKISDDNLQKICNCNVVDDGHLKNQVKCLEVYITEINCQLEQQTNQNFQLTDELRKITGKFDEAQVELGSFRDQYDELQKSYLKLQEEV